ncbi:ChbG/HpnK family deacetylase [Streptomyces sp. NPDC052042]|uniref:ChbG/HpnK family deacetylase n=1 Tax=Streptomyces sp. NPDC052042 TaxID=3365683 RepID=UPI0037CCCD2A
MRHSVNAAVIESIERGVVGSCGLMPPCPAVPDAMRLFGRSPSRRGPVQRLRECRRSKACRRARTSRAPGRTRSRPQLPLATDRRPPPRTLSNKRRPRTSTGTEQDWETTKVSADH